MGKTINFFHAAIFKNGQKTDINFLNFLDLVSTAIWQNKVRKIDYNITAAFPYYFNDSHREKRIVPMGKFRIDYKPLTGRINTPILREIQNDVIELITMVYDQNYKVAAIDFNINGLRQKSIELYLTSYLPRIQGETWEVKLLPIIAKRGIDDIRRSNQVRCLEVKLKLDKYTQNFINMGTETTQSLLLNLLNCIPQTTEDIEANILKIEFSSSNGRGTTINVASVISLLQALNLEHDYIDSIKVRYRDSRNDKLDTIDLKEIGNQLRLRILDDDHNTNPASEFVGNTIIEQYNLVEASLSASHAEFISDMIHADCPAISLIPRLENIVENNLA